MSFCTKCGTQNDADSRFCQNCGGNLAVTAQPSPPPPVVQAAASSAAPDATATSGRSAGLARLIERAKAITLSPNQEWPVIDTEPDQPKEVAISYVAILAAIGPIAAFIGMTLIGISIPFMGTVRIGVLGGLGTLVATYVLGVLAVFLVAWIADALAPTFAGQKNYAQAFKLVAYAYTPAWLAGVLNIIPMLGLLAVLAALYSLYVLYIGVPVMMKCPKEKALPYTAVLVVIAIVASLILSAATAIFTPRPNFGGSAKLDPSSPAGAILGGLTGTTDTAEATKRLETMNKSMEEASKRMEAASKSGDPAAATAAAGQAMGAIFGAGGKVETIAFQDLKAMLPDSIGGFSRTSATGEKNAMGGASMSSAEGRYQDGGQGSIELKIADMGGVGVLMAGAAAWSMMEMDRETESGRERAGKLDGRPFHEQYDNRGHSGEFSVIVGQRFLIEAKGRNVDMGTLKTTVNAVNLARLESMKDVGRSAN
jgi:hypothetical protein